MPTGLNFSTTVNVYSPTGSSGDPLSGAVKSLPSGILGKLQGLWQGIRGNAKPERSVIDAGPGDYRLQRKGQAGYQRLNILDRAPPTPRATYASPGGARVRVVPPQSASSPTSASVPASTGLTTSSGSGPAATPLQTLIAKVLTPPGPVPTTTPSAARSVDQLIDGLVTGSASRREQEAQVLADIDQLVKLADATGESLRPIPGTPKSDAARAFDMLASRLLTLNTGASGTVLRKLAETDATPAGLREAAYRHAAGPGQSAGGAIDPKLKIAVADRMLGHASRYDPPASELADLSAGDQAVLRTSRLREAERDTGEALATAADSIGDSVLALHRAGVLDAQTLKPLGDFPPLATQTHSASRADHVGALPVIAELMASMAKGNPGTINLLTAGDSRHDAVALKLKTIGLPEGSEARQQVTQQHVLSRAKHQLAQVWTQQEKVSRLADSGQALGGFGRLGTRMGKVINEGGSDGLRVNAQLLRILREGPGKDLAAREASSRQGAGIQADARAGKDVNLLIAQVMLLQKHVDAATVGDALQDSKDRLVREAGALPMPLQAKLGDGLSASALAPGERAGVIALGLSTTKHVDLLTQALSAQREHEVAGDHQVDGAMGARARLTSPDPEIRRQAVIDLEGKNGVYASLAREMQALPALDATGLPHTTETRLDAVILQREQAATTARAQLATASGCDALSPTDMRDLSKVLQGIHDVKAAEQQAHNAGEDASLGLSSKDFIDMGFSAEETAQVQQELSTQLGHPIESLFHQGLRSTADAAKVTDAVNNGIDRLFVKGTSSLTQSTMRDVSKAFPEAAARQYLAAVRDMAHPVVGTTAQGTSKGVFSGVFGDALSTQDKPLSRLLQRASTQVADAQALMATRVGELADLDTGAAVARKVLDQISTPARKLDASSDSAKVNATRLTAAGETLDTLDQVIASITTAQSDLAIIDAQASGLRVPADARVAAAQLAVDTSSQHVADLEAQLLGTQAGLAKQGLSASARAALDTDRVRIQQDLVTARATHANNETGLAQSQQEKTDLDTDLAQTRAPHAEILAMREGLRDALQTKLDAQITSLRWMSPSTLERSIRPQDRITNPDQLRAFLADPDTASAITALHTLHALPGAKEGKLRQITDQAAVADLALVAYRAALSTAPGKAIDPGQLQSAIRCAVLETALAWPDGPSGFDPAAHRDAIETRLQDWGLDSTVLRPEIDAVLHQNFDLAHIDSWTKEAEQAFKAPVAETPGMARRALDAARVFVTDNSPLDLGTRRSLLDSVRSMHVGDSLGLSRGLSWGLDTTPTPVEATGTLTAQVVVDIKSKNALDVRRTEEGVEIVFKAGMGGSGALGVGATLFGAAKLTATASGGHESLSGAGFRFPDTESAAKFLDTILDGKKISPRTWATATQTALVSDRATTVGGQLAAKVSAKNIIAKVPGSEVAMKYLMYEGAVAGSSFDFLGGAQAQLSASREWRTVQQHNASGHVIEKSRSTTVEGSVSVGMWASLPTVQDSVIDHFVDSNPVYTAIDDAVNRNTMMRDAPQGAFGAGAKDYGAPDNHVFDPFSPASAKIFSLNLSAKRTLTESTSLAFERDGLLSASGNVMTRSVAITSKASDKDLALVQPGFSSKSSRSRGDDSLYNAVKAMRESEASAKMLDELLASAGPGSSLSVTYALKEDARLVINDMIKSAEHAEKSGDLAKAQILGDLARTMYEDEKNYQVDTIQVAKSSSVDNSTTLGSVGIMTVGRVSEGSAERPTMILAMPGGPTARSMAAQPGRPDEAASSPASGGVSTPASVVDTGLASEAFSAGASGQASASAVHIDASSFSDAPAVLVDVNTLDAQAQAGAVAAQAPIVLPHPLETRFKGIEPGAMPALTKVAAHEFRLETQVAKACAIHAINAFTGGPATTIGEFEAWSAATGVPGIAPETSVSGFSAHRVVNALTLIQASPAARDLDWQVGMSMLSPSARGGALTRVTLPPLGDTDRLIFGVDVDRPGPGGGDVNLAHYVAFRKDEKNDWYLLDSRDTEVHAPAGTVADGNPIRRQIHPQTWLNEVTANAKLRAVELIGPGITQHALKDDSGTLVLVP